MGETMRPHIASVLVVATLATAACSAGEATDVSPSAFDSPTTAARSWFAAVNRKDRPAALAHFEPASARIGDWGAGPSTWPTFSSVACKGETETSSPAGDARVRCSFHESDAPAAGQPSSWWDVYLRRQPDGRWLISSYGQG